MPRGNELTEPTLGNVPCQPVGDTRIVRLVIDGFRGVPNKLVVDFRDKCGTPSSLLICGDNGTGKSTIVDALEYALRGNVRGRWLPLYSLFAATESATTVDFADGTSFTRGATPDTRGKWRRDTSPHRSFCISPFVLRRSDITRFWETPDHERQIAFDSFLRPGTKSPVEKQCAVQSVLNSLGAAVTDSFRELSAASEHVVAIELLYQRPTSTTLAFNVHLVGGRVVPPQQIFSEANLDLLALLVYLAFVEEASRRGQSKLLVLDDTLQSVDAPVRQRLAEHIVDRFHDWQIVFTAHDRLWQEQLRALMRQRAHRFLDLTISHWSYHNGPILAGSDRNVDQALTEALDCGRVSDICARANLLVELVCHEMSQALPTSVIRRRGDRYTLGDLWPGVYKVLSRTTAKDFAEAVQRWIHLRNIAGAHYNEWAMGLSMHEARQFGEAVLNLANCVWCNVCHSWVERHDLAEGRANWACRCRNKRVERLRIDAQ